jgi:imidazoleglycerol-phosphate dehydratase
MTVLERKTRETQIRLQLERSAPENTEPAIETGIPFLDHMLRTLARYGGLGLHIKAAGDLRHHLIEDVAITLGLALRQETPAASTRFADIIIPMDDALVQVALDLGGRAYYRGPIPSTLYDHFLRSLAENAAITLHVRVLRGRDRHHIVEATFKALGIALRHALAPGDAVFSTKGEVRTVRGDG